MARKKKIDTYEEQETMFDEEPKMDSTSDTEDDDVDFKADAQFRSGVFVLPNKNITSSDKEAASEHLSTEILAQLKNFTKISKENRLEMINCDITNIRYCVQAYYQAQLVRINLGGKLRAMQQRKSIGTDNIKILEEVPHSELLQWMFNQFMGIENEIKKTLDVWSDIDPVANWAKHVYGIGPVIASGLTANFDVERAPSVSHFYSYAGLNDNNNPWLGKDKSRALVNRHCKKPTVTNEELIALANDPDCPRSLEKLLRYAYDPKKDKLTRESLINNMAKIPYNKDLKVLCWKAGESFSKVSNKEGSLYGKLYRERKLLEQARNERLDFKDQAEKALSEKNYKKTTEAYKYYSSGMLPPAQIKTRAERYAVKIFISHLYEEMYRVRYNDLPPRPYVFAHLEHTDVIAPEYPYTELDPKKPKLRPSNPVKKY